MASLIRHLVRCLLLAALIFTAVTYETVNAAELGDRITNVARLTYTDRGSRVDVLSNKAVFTIQGRPTPSTIEFFRHAPSLPNATAAAVNGSDYAPNGSPEGPFEPVSPATNAVGAPIDLSGPVRLSSAEAFLTGEMMFVRVEDPGRNGYPEKVERVVVSVRTDSGDTITLRLYESGPDTGEFWAYAPSTRDLTAADDPSLTTAQGMRLTATYVDSFDATEVSVDTALVDPFGRVFQSLTGELLDDLRVTIVDAATGEPAPVFGIDGVSPYPSSVITGSRVVDDGGFVYDLEPGEFRFPLMAPGEYAVQVETPDGLTMPSTLRAPNFDGLENAPFVIADASYGRSFILDGLGPINFDIPLDPESDLVVSKTAEPSIGDVGDFIQYTVTLENRGNQRVPITLRDIAPPDFRYVSGSSRVDGERIADPEISEVGSTFRYRVGAVAPGETAELSYVLEIGAGAEPGDAVNAAMAIDGNGETISNIARAPVTIREDLFRTQTTIIGRVAEGACEADHEWARPIGDGIGIEGVRLYLETGVHAISDEDGLYHFEDVTAGTHVVQIDTATLPDGYEPMVCEENTRYASSATSKFVDIKGGNVWRANFYLKRTGDAAAEDGAAGFNDVTEYKRYDADWLAGQGAEIEWVYPDASRTPSQPSVNIGIKHGAEHTVRLSLNGAPVPAENFQARDSDKAGAVYITRWRGVDLKEGRNVFSASVADGTGEKVAALTREIWFIDRVARAIPVPDRSVPVADGRTAPVIAVRIEDEAGRPVHSGRLIDVEVAPPYRLDAVDRREQTDELTAPFSARASVPAGPDGIARIRLEPTLKTGRVDLTVTLDDGRRVPVQMYLEPEKRDWIIVGLAEGTIGYETIRREGTGGRDESEVFTDGRVAFFAKGLIKGEWLLTLAVDTDRRHTDGDGDFDTEIDPDAYYTLYGDQSYQEQEAASRYPLYVKLEKNQFYAMFGDYDTRMTDAKLTRYTRRLSGLKSEYVGDRFRIMAFGAETNQGFAKDEIPADGTSGAFRLGTAPILADSETITIETRDRFRPDIVTERRRLVRHLDYTLDTETGELIFRLPVPINDAALNPNVIVVEYETETDAERNLTYGGRVEGDLLDGAVTVGAAYVREGGSDTAADSEGELGGVDIVARIGKSIEARAELARSRTRQGGSEDKAAAWLGEVTYRRDRITAEAYAREEEENFGLGQQSSNTAGARRIGIRGQYEFEPIRDEETGRVTNRRASADVYHEENLRTGAERIVGEAKVSQDTERWGAHTGIRTVQEEDTDGEMQRSTLGLIGGRLSFPEEGAIVTAAHEQPLGGGEGVESFPQRTTLGLTKELNGWADVTVTHEYRQGDDLEAHTTSAGLKVNPWAGATVTTGSDMLTGESGRRLGATVGLDQQVDLDDNWTTSAGLTHHRVLHERGKPDSLADDADSPIETGGDTIVAYAGVGFRTDVTSGSGRLEARSTETDDAYILSSSVVRELSEDLSVAGSARTRLTRYSDGQPGRTETRADAKLGLAWRPRVEKAVVLNRLDLKYRESRVGEKTTKFVNNVAVNTPVGSRMQVAAHHGIKYVMTSFDGETHAGWTHLVGGEARYDVTRVVDLGIHGSILYTPGSGTAQYAWGPSIGVKPIDNVWLSLGYNFEGFADEDFEAARYTRDGLFMKLRVKFDEDTARGILDFIAPDVSTGNL